VAQWRPCASLQTLQLRAHLLARIRSFFAAAGVMEVETPLLCPTAATDPALASMHSRYTGPGAPAGRTLYLQTSPEAAMKRLLAAGSGPIYQLCKAFRDGERGRRHNPEFTILEWYRPGFDHLRLMDEVGALVRTLLGLAEAERLSYREAFLRYCRLDPHTAETGELRAHAAACGVSAVAGLDAEARDGWLDLLLSHQVEPRLGRERPTFLYDYPASQAALARVVGDPPVARRFELYVDGLELANGYHELTDAVEQRRRLLEDLEIRRARGLPELPLDTRLLDALAAGLPDCAGVALGVDRLVMMAARAESLDQVLAFPLPRA